MERNNSNLHRSIRLSCNYTLEQKRQRQSENRFKLKSKCWGHGLSLADIFKVVGRSVFQSNKARRLNKVTKKTYNLNKHIQKDLIRARRLIPVKGKNGEVKWETVFYEKRRPNIVQELEQNTDIVYKAEDDRRLMAGFLKTESSNGVTSIGQDETLLGTPNFILSDESCESIIAPVGEDELTFALDSFTESNNQISKLRNAILENVELDNMFVLCSLFNNIIGGNITSNDWTFDTVWSKIEGPLSLDSSDCNPRSICKWLSKVLSRILTLRIINVVAESHIIGDLMNKFIKGTSCSEDIFLLNSILELNSIRKRPTHLLFVDFNEAMDLVDRNILLIKLKQLNFPAQFLNYLKDFYLDDVLCKPKRKFIKKNATVGLRSCCDLSSILFTIYLSELSQKIASSDGIAVANGKIVGILKLGDKIVLAADSAEKVDGLNNCIKEYCSIFKIKVRVKKAQVIYPGKSYDWSIIDEDIGSFLELKLLEEKEYLGAERNISVTITSAEGGSNVVCRALMFKQALLRLKRRVPGQIDVFRLAWENVAVPAILYGIEGVPVDDETMSKLDKIQDSIAYSLLGLHKSTISLVSEIEIGFKPFSFRIVEAKIKFWITLNDHLNSEKNLEALNNLNLLIKLKDTNFILNLRKFLEPINMDENSLDFTAIGRLNEYHKGLVLNLVRTVPTLRLMTSPKRWWTLQPHVDGGEWSKVLSSFRAMNAGLGNKIYFYKSKALFKIKNEQLVLDCPICLDGTNEELHLVMSCKRMEKARRLIKVGSMLSLKDKLDFIRAHYCAESNENCLRLFLGEEVGLKQKDYVNRGLALAQLLEYFFMEWLQIVQVRSM